MVREGKASRTRMVLGETVKVKGEMRIKARGTKVRMM